MACVYDAIDNRTSVPRGTYFGAKIVGGARIQLYLEHGARVQSLFFPL